MLPASDSGGGLLAVDAVDDGTDEALNGLDVGALQRVPLDEQYAPQDVPGAGPAWGGVCPARAAGAAAGRGRAAWTATGATACRR